MTTPSRNAGKGGKAELVVQTDGRWGEAAGLDLQDKGGIEPPSQPITSLLHGAARVSSRPQFLSRAGLFGDTLTSIRHFP